MKYLNTLAIILIIFYLYSQVNYFGGVRSETTGFWLAEGENITIGTTTPTLADIHIYRTASSSMAIDGGLIGCLVIRNKDTGNLDYWYSGVSGMATTTNSDCGL